MKYSNANFKAYFRLKYIKVFCLKSIFILLVSSCGYAEESMLQVVEIEEEELELPIEVGAQRMGEYLHLLEGKSIGIVGNQSSMVGETHLVDTLLSLDVQIKRVFSPEHGFRGDADAGELVSNQTDSKTGLPIVSLYGKNKKPRQDQLTGIDLMVFDIQDVGVRFYTYISTLHYVMEACAEKGIPLVILDRPNPNGHYVDGPIREAKYKSFVSMHPVPIVHGMTIGEYGMMINGEGWLTTENQCELSVIKCGQYDHMKSYSLPVPPSPNLRSDLAISLYPSLCLLEATDVTVGRGTERPFEQFGHPDFPDSLAYEFTPAPNLGAKKPKHNGVLCHGVLLNDTGYYRMSQLDLSFLFDAHHFMKGDLFRGRKKRMFYLLCGTDEIEVQMEKGMSEEEIRATWKSDLEEFMEVREKYLLYP